MPLHRTKLWLAPRVILALAGMAFACRTSDAVTLQWVSVGDPGNSADTSPAGFGSVDYEYRLAAHEVTISQYVEFLNATARSDPYGLWNAAMAATASVAGISRSGSPGSYSYVAFGPVGIMPSGADSPGNRPVTFVSWFDAARFANWMNNGQGEGSTETGAYSLAGATTGVAPAKTPGAIYYIPTENEWYKAAFYRGSGTAAGYWDYATQSNTPPGNTIGSGTNQANYYTIARGFATGSVNENSNLLTNVGAFSASLSAYGTFDQSGNVYEWNDLAGQAGLTRGVRGGYWYSDPSDLSSSSRSTVAPTLENDSLGFRLAMLVPEPSTWAITCTALLTVCLMQWWKRALPQSPGRNMTS